MRWFNNLSDYDLYRFKKICIDNNCRYVIRKKSIGIDKKRFKKNYIRKEMKIKCV